MCTWARKHSSPGQCDVLAFQPSAKNPKAYEQKVLFFFSGWWILLGSEREDVESWQCAKDSSAKSGKIVKQSALKTVNIVTHLVTGFGPMLYYWWKLVFYCYYSGSTLGLKVMVYHHVAQPTCGKKYIFRWGFFLKNQKLVCLSSEFREILVVSCWSTYNSHQGSSRRFRIFIQYLIRMFLIVIFYDLFEQVNVVIALTLPGSWQQTGGNAVLLLNTSTLSELIIWL